MRHIDTIIIHCTATPAGRDVTAAEVNRWHRAQGWECIGYHYLIRLDGSVETGRPLDMPGAHCRGHNARSIGVAYAGGLDPQTLASADTRTPAQRHALHSLVGSLLTRFPHAAVRGHSDFSPKACPCFDVSAEFPSKC